jgi:hypothetical protein
VSFFDVRVAATATSLCSGKQAAAATLAHRVMKYVLVTGGVVSGLGKGVTASSIGVLLKNSGLRVTSIKIGEQQQHSCSRLQVRGRSDTPGHCCRPLLEH